MTNAHTLATQLIEALNDKEKIHDIDLLSIIAKLNVYDEFISENIDLRRKVEELTAELHGRGV